MKKNSYIGLVFTKELKDLFRDRRTIIVGLLVPLLLYPLIFTLMGSGIKSTQKEAQTNTTVALLDGAREQSVKEYLSTEVFKGSDIKIVDEADPKQALADGKVKVVLSIAQADAGAFVRGDSIKIQLYYNDTKTDSNASLQVVETAVARYNTTAVDQKLKDRFGTSIAALQPVQMAVPVAYNANTASGKASGGAGQVMTIIIPMLLIIMVAMGSMASAVDLFAGEKERMTLEPLLSTHAGRGRILTGKFLAVAFMGTLSSALMLGGMFIGYKLNPEMLGDTGQTGAAASTGTLSMPLPAILLIVLIILMVQLSFTAVHVMLSTFARNVKEATTYGTLILLAGMLPAYGTMFLSSGDVSYWMMYVPVLNVVGALKMLLGGIVNYAMVGISLVISAAFLLVLLFYTRRMFNKESVIFRT